MLNREMTDDATGRSLGATSKYGSKTFCVKLNTANQLGTLTNEELEMGQLHSA